MPGYLLHVGATVTCSHPPGPAQPMSSVARVKVTGQPIVTLNIQYTVTGCALSTSSSPFCTSAKWLTGATRVKALNNPVLLQDSQSMSPQTLAPLKVMLTQVRVKGI
jgi:hypothetical protein